MARCVGREEGVGDEGGGRRVWVIKEEGGGW